MKPDLGAAALSYPTGVRGLSASGIPIPVRNEYYNLAPGAGLAPAEKSQELCE